jgi:hypothetical protein
VSNFPREPTAKKGNDIVRCASAGGGVVSPELRQRAGARRAESLPAAGPWGEAANRHPPSLARSGSLATPQRGFRVREFCVEDIAGLTQSRMQIESVALRPAIGRGDVPSETQIVAAHHLPQRTPLEDDNGSLPTAKRAARHGNRRRAQ